MSTTNHNLAERALKVHENVCETHYDESVMNSDGTCSECQDDYHEFQILSRTK